MPEAAASPSLPPPADIDGGADLHAHTSASDGLLSPAEMVAAAVSAGLRVVAVTDHDTVAGVAPAIAAAAELPGHPIEVVPGIEISCHSGGRELHLLGLFIDPRHAALRELAASQRRVRRERAEVMVARVQRDHPSMSMRLVEEQSAGGAIGRPHVARAMTDAGIVPDPQTAFDRFLGIGRPCFVPKELPRIEEAIAIVRAAGGVAVIAHPGSSRVRQSLYAELVEAGLEGVEVRHPKHGRQRERLLLALSVRHGLLPSGGSDFHGPGRGAADIGQHRVPIDWYENLRRRAEQRRGEMQSEETGA